MKIILLLVLPLSVFSQTFDRKMAIMDSVTKAYTINGKIDFNKRDSVMEIMFPQRHEDLLVGFPKAWDAYPSSKVASARCPVRGNSPQERLQHLDSLKNRSDTGTNPLAVDIHSFYQQAPVLSDTQFISITGYIKLVKYGGGETCNCRSVDHRDQDYHIEVVDTLFGDHEPVICEVNRFVRPMTYLQLKGLVGTKVTITGWVFYDIEHKQNSVDENPNGTDFWRQTDIEIHPVIFIK